MDEDVFMNVSPSTFSATQMILAWTLIGVLVSWLVIFTVLALRVFVMNKAEFDDLSTTSHPLPVLSARPTDIQPQYVRAGTSTIVSKSTNSNESRDGNTIPIK
jgi:hypothetical protein